MKLFIVVLLLQAVHNNLIAICAFFLPAGANANANAGAGLGPTSSTPTKKNHKHCNGRYKTNPLTQTPTNNSNNNNKDNLECTTTAAATNLDDAKNGDATALQKQLVNEMVECISSLSRSHLGPTDHRPDVKTIERWASIVHSCMSSPSRSFHTVRHAFDVLQTCRKKRNGNDPIQTMGALFHDCVYCSVDGGLPPPGTIIGDLLHDVVRTDVHDENNNGNGSNNSDVVCLPPVYYLTTDPLEVELEMVSDIFGYTKGQKLDPTTGLNEYLSAVLAVRCLKSTAAASTMTSMAEVAACIEASIPFRANAKPMEALYGRLAAANTKYGLGMAEPDLAAAVRRAADFANADVHNFADDDVAAFLSNTWTLLPESNVPLRDGNAYRISEYAAALDGMARFFANLKADAIFVSCQCGGDGGDRSTVDAWTKKAGENIAISTTYLQCKRLAIAVVGAFAELTGGDAPIASILGELPNPNSGRSRFPTNVVDIIDVGAKPDESIELDGRVFSLLYGGRERESKFDIKASPIAALLYSHIGDGGLKEALNHVTRPMDRERSKSLLASLPKEAVIEIGKACAIVSTTRSKALKEIVQKIERGISL